MNEREKILHALALKTVAAHGREDLVSRSLEHERIKKEASIHGLSINQVLVYCQSKYDSLLKELVKPKK